MKSEIESTLKQYLQAFYQQDFDTMLGLLYEDDVIEYRNSFVEFAVKMDEFGETDGFLKRLKIKNIDALQALSVQEFMVSIFKMVTRSIGKKDLKKMINGTKITHIDETEYLTIVKYEIPLQMFGEWNKLESEVTMILSGGGWKLFFKSGLNVALERFQKEIDLFHERKRKDNIEKIEHLGDLTKYTLVGYKNMEGEIVFEARFKDGGDFVDGLAFVKVMTKYGYIDAKGDLAIKPQFLDARTFSQKRAAVKVQIDKKGDFWGFINTKGKMVVKPQFQETSEFSSGLCAVMKDDKWGYINKKGETIISFEFEEAGDFSAGFAYVELRRQNGELTELALDKKAILLIKLFYSVKTYS